MVNLLAIGSFKPEVVEVICPTCKKRKMNLMKEYAHTPCSYWVCPDCVHVYMQGYFDVFNGFEYLVLRKGESIEEKPIFAKLGINIRRF